MEDTKKVTEPRQWTNFCHKHGGHFQSTSAVDIVCAACSMGGVFGNMADVFSGFAGFNKKKA